MSPKLKTKKGKQEAHRHKSNYLSLKCFPVFFLGCNHCWYWFKLLRLISVTSWTWEMQLDKLVEGIALLKFYQ